MATFVVSDLMTAPQLDYVRALAKKIRLPERMIDDHCTRRFRRVLAKLSKADASALIDEMIGWKAIPADLQRSMGQKDLF